MKKLKMLLLSVVAASGLLPLFGGIAMAQTSGQAVTCGVSGNLTGNATNCTATGDAGADTKINNTITLVIRIFQIIVGLISVVMIIFGGLKYVTSGGDSSGIGSAKNTIIYALIGIVVVVLAQVIVQFVLNRVNTVGTGI